MTETMPPETLPPVPTLTLVKKTPEEPHESAPAFSPHFAFSGSPQLYRYELWVSPALKMKKSVVISALHKLDRRDLAGQRKSLVAAFFVAFDYFFDAVRLYVTSKFALRRAVLALPAEKWSEEAEAEAVAKALADAKRAAKAAVTHFFNRFVIALFEEGSFLHLPDAQRHEVVSTIVRARKHCQQAEWKRAGRLLVKCVDATTGVPRGRLGSLARSHIILGDGSNVPPDVARLYRDLEVRYKGDRVTAQERADLGDVVRRMPAARPLLDTSLGFDACKELCRVIWMSAALAPIMSDSARRGPTEPVKFLAPTAALLEEIGVFDLHVRGLNHDSHEEFLNKGSRVANPTTQILFGSTYTDMDAVYVARKRALLAAAPVTPPKASKKRKAADGPAAEDAAVSPSPAAPGAPVASEERAAAKATSAEKRAAKEARRTEVPPPPPPPARPREAGPDVFDLVEPVSGLLGFKNATVLGTLKVAVGELKQGEKVFVKMGESPANGAYSMRCYECMRALEMPCVQMELTTAVYDPQTWYTHATSDTFATPPHWLRSMLKHMQPFEHRAVPTQVVACFDGMRLADVPKTHPKWLVNNNAGRSLFEAFFFAKWKGVQDLGPYNMLLNANGDALLVDLNEAGDVQWPKYNAKGLQTAHKLKNAGPGGDHLARALHYAAENPTQAAEFVECLVRTPPHPRLVSDLFTETARAELRAGGAAPGQPFWKACMKGAD